MRRAFVLAALLGVGGCKQADAPLHLEDLSVPADMAMHADLAAPDLLAPDLAQLSWVQQSVPVPTSLYAIAGAGGEIFVVGDQGAILQTTDDGAHWHLQGSGTNAALFGVWTDGNTAIAVGYHGTILRSTDHGATWQTTIFGSATLLGVSGSTSSDDGGAATRLFAVGEAGTVLQSNDGGATWAGSSGAFSTMSLSGVWASPIESFAVGGGGLYRTRDDGLSWQEVAFEPGKQVWATGSGQILIDTGNEIVRSRDGGLTWSSLTPSAPIAAFTAFVGGEMWIAEADGSIVHYVNDFEQLVMHDTAQVPAPIKAVFGSDTTNLFVVGDNGFIAHRQ